MNPELLLGPETRTRKQTRTKMTHVVHFILSTTEPLAGQQFVELYKESSAFLKNMI